jgi:hypothetical protein
MYKSSKGLSFIILSHLAQGGQTHPSGGAQHFSKLSGGLDRATHFWRFHRGRLVCFFLFETGECSTQHICLLYQFTPFHIFKTFAKTPDKTAAMVLNLIVNLKNILIRGIYYHPG